MKEKHLIIGLFICMILSYSCTKEKYIFEDGNLVPKTVEQDASLSAISVNGTMLHAETFGNSSDPLLIVLHGGPGSDYRYLLNCREFSTQGYYVVFYDQRGSGLSKRHDKSSYTIQLMIDDLSAVINHFKTSEKQKIFLLGHSWGAMLATAFINEYPFTVNGVVLAEPGGFKWNDVTQYIERAQDYRLTSETFSDALFQDQFITGKENEHTILDYKYALLAAAENTRESPIGNEGPLPFWRNGAVVNKALLELGEEEAPDWTQHLNQFTTKVLFVYSERNKAYGLAHAQNVSAAYPTVQLFEVKNAGHDMISFPAGWQQFYPEALSYYNSLR